MVVQEIDQEHEVCGAILIVNWANVLLTSGIEECRGHLGIAGGTPRIENPQAVELQKLTHMLRLHVAREGLSSL
jgi:hypothetical protein